ncbi:hypothetical protein CUN64_23240 [Serratia sp. TKO39]|nr:hypothetical protein CUN64_23240 [Serratia sp. TKO39]
MTVERYIFSSYGKVFFAAFECFTKITFIKNTIMSLGIKMINPSLDFICQLLSIWKINIFSARIPLALLQGVNSKPFMQR